MRWGVTRVIALDVVADRFTHCGGIVAGRSVLQRVASEVGQKRHQGWAKPIAIRFMAGHLREREGRTIR